MNFRKCNFPTFSESASINLSTIINGTRFFCVYKKILLVKILLQLRHFLGLRTCLSTNFFLYSSSNNCLVHGWEIYKVLRLTSKHVVESLTEATGLLEFNKVTPQLIFCVLLQLALRFLNLYLVLNDSKLAMRFLG